MEEARLLPALPVAFYLTNQQKFKRYKCVKQEETQTKINEYIREAVELHSSQTTNNVRKFDKDAFCLITTQQFNLNKKKFQDHRMYSNTEIRQPENYKKALELKSFEDENGIRYQPLPIMGVPKFDVFDDANENDEFFEAVKKNNPKFFFNNQKEENKKLENRTDKSKEEEEEESKENVIQRQNKAKGLNSLKNIFQSDKQITNSQKTPMENLMKDMNLKSDESDELPLNQQNFKKSNMLIKAKQDLEVQNKEKAKKIEELQKLLQERDEMLKGSQKKVLQKVGRPPNKTRNTKKQSKKQTKKQGKKKPAKKMQEEAENSQEDSEDEDKSVDLTPLYNYYEKLRETRQQSSSDDEEEDEE